MNERNEYAVLFNGITDVMRQLQTLTLHLQNLQCKAEEIYMEKDN
ncbi:hypothetical protein RWV98_03490 [Agathobaculum sp. NTUH-O15-33]|nr:hypothetical protein [Agathobaculum sp. NTUH-O15-33]WNX85351.1 hypothetical protein RWV98_03490 [Agathobaculum sp. NTUH-O15-33]